MVKVCMILKRGYLMFLTYSDLHTTIYPVKTMICRSLYVNHVNNKSIHSHDHSHGKALNNNIICKPCERVNIFSRAYVRDCFYTLYFIFIPLSISVLVFFFFTCARIFLFTHSHFIRINIKTIAYHVNELKTLFTCHSHDSHGV